MSSVKSVGQSGEIGVGTSNIGQYGDPESLVGAGRA